MYIKSKKKKNPNPKPIHISHRPKEIINKKKFANEITKENNNPFYWQ